ncbi:3-phosphoshikimate 1-carboxyvinyltransferase [bacterium]|nr:3-phosphoshikimate 1-carboxyvinyltransferase [bacterium]
MSVAPGGALRGTVRIPGDKSLSHRAVMLASLASGSSRITHFLPGEDCLGTIRCFRAMGVPIEGAGSEWIVHGQGLHGLKEPGEILDVGNSGTTVRLMLGLLAGIDGFATVTGDASIRKRPMGRIVAPLRQMGASIDGREDGTLAPLAVRGRKLSAIHYQSPVASAQIKSAVLLAGLRAEGTTSVTEPLLSRDHTELMLAAMGARIRRDGLTVSVEGGHELSPCDVEVPGDISSAAFWLVAASIAPGSDLLLENVGINPTRTGVLDVLERMGADITRLNAREIAGEQVADLRVRAAKLTGTSIQGEVIPRLVDEIPILALAAACATGTTLVRDAQELRVKESDRLSAIATELGKLGAKIQELPDGLIIEGGTRWHGERCESRGDHRIAMMLGLAALVTPQPVEIEGVRCTETSYPGFWETLTGLRA